VRPPREDQLFSGHLDMCERCAKAFPQYEVCTMIGGPWSFGLELRGIEEAMEDMYDDKPFLHDLMAYTTETVILRCLAAAELGVHPVIGDPSSGMSLISPAIYREHVLPYHRKIVDAVHEKGSAISFHICGFVDPIFEDLLGLGIDGLSIDAPSSLEKLFALGRGKTTIMGNVDPILFVQGTPDQLREEAGKCIGTAAGEARYVVGPGCQIPLGAKIENIKAFTQACHRLGAF
jgi:uroporphyrinogen decarboxylase